MPLDGNPQVYTEGQLIHEWNDAPGRTAEEVAAALEAAAEQSS